MIKKDSIVGSYKIICDHFIRDSRSNKKYLVEHIYTKKVYFVRESNILKSRGKKAPGNLGWSTRTDSDLPMYVYNFPHSNKPYRVCVKLNGEVLTVGYYKTLKEAERMAKNENICRERGNEV